MPSSKDGGGWSCGYRTTMVLVPYCGYGEYSGDCRRRDRQAGDAAAFMLGAKAFKWVPDSSAPRGALSIKYKAVNNAADRDTCVRGADRPSRPYAEEQIGKKVPATEEKGPVLRN